MSIETRFSSKDVKVWLERETNPLLVPIHSKAKRLLDEMQKSIGNLLEASKMLLENSQKEIEKRNPKTYSRARALNKLARLFVDRLRQVRAPDEAMYGSFSEFARETQKALSVTEVDVRNWFPRISPFFILDRRKFQAIFEKSKSLHEDLDAFSEKEYVKTKTLEETFQCINELQALELQLSRFLDNRAKIQSERNRIQNEIDETHRKIEDLKNKGELKQLVQIALKIGTLSAEVKQSLQHLQKPFVKLQSLATHGEGSGLTPDELRKLSQYVDDPFGALATEETGYPLLRQILHKLSLTMPQNRLKLKPEKSRKASQVIDSIVTQNSLNDLYQRCISATVQKKNLSASAEVAEAERRLAMLREQLEGQERQERVVAGEQTTVERACNEATEKIRTLKGRIENNVFDFMNRKIQID